VRLADASSAPFIYTVWVYYRSYMDHFRGQEQLYLEINRALKNAGVSPVGDLQEVRYSKAPVINPNNPSIADTLRSMDMFSELENDEIDVMAASSEYVIVAKDTVLLEEKAASTNVYVVVNGSLESSIKLDKGQQVPAEQFSAGDSFGWATIVTDEKSIMTVTASSDSLVLVIDGTCLQPILKSHEALQYRFFELVNNRLEKHSHIRSGVLEKRRSLSPMEIRRRIERFVAGGNR